MNWLSSNWVWIVLVVGFLALHLFGHGHGRHGYANHGRRRNVGDDGPGHAHESASPAATSAPTDGSDKNERPAHRHRGC